MSSFVVSKCELKKAAGFLAALAEYDMPGGRHMLWWYDYQTGKRATIDTFAAMAEKIHLLNALSVQQQYGDDMPEVDPELYSGAMQQAYTETRELIKSWSWRRGDGLKKALFRFGSFCDSVLYQIECEPASEAAESILYRWKNAAFDVLRKVEYLEDECTSWGDFSPMENETA